MVFSSRFQSWNCYHSPPGDGLHPESPFWLIVNSRREEAVEILVKIRGDVPPSEPALAAELGQLDTIVVVADHKRYRFRNVAFGCYSGHLHLGRRVGLAIGIMMMEWTGILAITVYADTLFQQAGFSADKASWLFDLCNTFGILGTAASVLTVDRFGRRKSLYFKALFFSFLEGLSRLGELHPSSAAAYGAASAAFVFVYTFFFAQTVLMIASHPTEI
jgi:hypothetical protein